MTINPNLDPRAPSLALAMNGNASISRAWPPATPSACLATISQFSPGSSCLPMPRGSTWAVAPAAGPASWHRTWAGCTAFTIQCPGRGLPGPGRSAKCAVPPGVGGQHRPAAQLPGFWLQPRRAPPRARHSCCHPLLRRAPETRRAAAALSVLRVRNRPRWYSLLWRLSNAPPPADPPPAAPPQAAHH